MTDISNQAVVEEVYDAFRRKDLSGVLALQAENSEWSVAASADRIPWASPGDGHAGVARFLRTLGEWLVADVFRIHNYLVNGDTVVALGFQQGTVRPTGEAYAFDFVHVWTVVDRRVARFRVYYDTAYVGSLITRSGG